MSKLSKIQVREPDQGDLDHAVGALLAMPSTPTLQSSQWTEEEDVDIFTLLLNEMDTSTPRMGGNPPSSSSMTPISGQFTPVDDLSTAFTWADALNSESLMNGSFYFNSATTNEVAPVTATPLSSSSSRSFPIKQEPEHPFNFLSASSTRKTTNSSSYSSSSSSATMTTSTTVKKKNQIPISALNESSHAKNSKSKKTSPTPQLSPIQTEHSSNRSSDGEQDDDDQEGDSKLSPKSFAIREKNREAVRKCRQKKKEREDALNERIRLLENENEEIRVQLRLGSEDRVREVEMESNRRAKRLEDLLELSNVSPSTDLDNEIREACNSYMTHSQERSEDRAAALSGALSRVSRLIDPTLFAKFYLWHGTAKDDYFTNPNGLWASISAEMNITPDQTAKLSERREKLERLRAQIMDVSCKLHELQTNVTMKEKVDVDGVFQKSIQALMTPRQLAKFILWVRKDPAVQRVTNSTTVLSKFLNQVTEQPSEFDFDHLSKAREAALEAAHAQGRKSRLEVARERIIFLNKGLWDAPKEDLERIAQEALSPDVTLIDPNNGGEYHGINKTIQYVHRIRLAFGEKITVDLREMSLDKDKARATWVLQGTYRGRLGSNLPSNNNSSSSHGSVATTPTQDEQPKHLKHVSFVIVITYTFRPDSTLIQEMLVAWDAIGLMRQIGLLKNTSNGPTKGIMAPPPKKQRSSIVRFDEIQALRMSRVEELAKLFSSPLEEMAAMAKEILHPECVFQDSYMGFEFRGLVACTKYAQKVRNPFPTLSVTGVKISENEGAALGSPLRLDWNIRAKYSGPLVNNVTDCSFNAVLFVTFDSMDHTIDSVHFSWNAQRLMDQLGIMRKIDFLIN